MQLQETILLAGFGTLLILVLLWFLLIAILFRWLEARHQDKYAEMGRPTLFRRNNLRTNYTTLKFLFGREHRELDDPALARLADGLLVFTVIYLALFIGLLVYFGTVQTDSRRIFQP